MVELLVSKGFYIGIAALVFIIVGVFLFTLFKTEDYLREEQYEKMLAEEALEKENSKDNKELSL